MMLELSPRRRADVLNLCFHGIGAPGRELEVDEAQYWVEAEQFDELLGVIRRHPSIRITFDDGNASDVTHALPALVRHNLTATFFVVAGRLDQPGSVSRDDVKTLVASGMTIGSHGLAHRPWRSVGTEELRAEMGASSILADITSVPVRQAACPFGSYDRRVLSALRDHGYARVYTVDEGHARETAWLQSRYTIRSCDSPAVIEEWACTPRRPSMSSTVREGKKLIKRLR